MWVQLLRPKGERTYGILGAIVTQLELGMLQDPGQPRPERQAVMA
jgi:hypothetical protein